MRAMNGALLSVVLLLAVGIANTQDNQTCSYTCTITQQQQDGGGSWVVIMDNGVTYFYLQAENVFIVYNQYLQYIILVDGNSGTTTILNTQTGFGIVVNLVTNVAYIINQDMQTFDMSTLADGSYQVVISIYQYISIYIEKVTAADVDTTAVGYFSMELLLSNLQLTADVTQWSVFEGQGEIVSQFQSNFQIIINVIFELYQSQSYSAESGTSIFMVAITQIYNSEDQLLTDIDQFAIFLVQTLDGKVSSALMAEYYMLITSNESITYKMEQFMYLTWAIKGVGTTYQTLDEALIAYQQHVVVETHVSTITDGNNSSYTAYNSMRNGTWLFRIMYSNKQFVQITASYTGQYMAIFDPSLPFVLVFAEGQNMGFINWSTGNGLVINGASGQAVYVKSTTDEISSKFQSGLIAEGFIAISDLVLRTDNTGEDSFQGADLLSAIVQAEDISEIIRNEADRESFEQEFAYLSDLANINVYDPKIGVINLVSFMLVNTKSTFFQSGFVVLIHNMYQFNIATARFYLDIYAGILYSIQTEWDAPIFENVNTILATIPTKDRPSQLIAFLESYMNLMWNINVADKLYYVDGTIGGTPA